MAVDFHECNGGALIVQRGSLSLNILGPNNSVLWEFSSISGPCPLGVRSTKPVQVQQAEESDVLGLAED